ncbi:rhodanese-like domain-containing protein [Sediminimonas sp.]|uniref:rhodanese-like domain-containing protein n=1 Tax=Sediminimonas sp. TaxID=2823379 RepID=UPI0025D9FEEE|nr:rhodanese-like domain-containing protein [Sediminimonas sp.]
MPGFLRPAPTTTLPETLIDQIAAGAVTLIDIRDAAELARTGQAQGALHIPMMRLPMVADPRHPDHDARLSPDKPVALYCATGARSGMAARLLRQMGYAEVHNIGGLDDWIAAGGPCTR